MKRKITSLLCGLVISTLSITSPLVGQNSSKSGTSKGGSQKNPSSFASKLTANMAKSIDDQSDYVPCFFSQQQLLQLQPRAVANLLSDAEAEALRENVISQALDPENAAAFKSEKDQQDFAGTIGGIQFAGRTQSQALSEVLSIFSQYSKPPSEFVAKLSQDGPEFAQYFSQQFGDTNHQSDIESEVEKDVTPTSDLNGKFAAVTILAESLSKKKLLKAGSDPVSTIKKEEEEQAKSKAAKDHVADAATGGPAITQRPLDIGCSMSVFSYETTRKAFGETMANEYIAVQIVVRNLNPSQEFLVQSAQLRVDDDINGRAGRYASGVDKMTAREFMLTTRDFGKRNLWMHIAQGSATVLSAFVPFTGSAVKQASGVYGSGVMGALTTIFPDHNTDQLKLIDDEGFSNYRTDRTVVPKSGTAEFVMFISSKEFEEGWWTQSYADKISVQTPAEVASQACCIGTFNTATPNPKCVNTAISTAISIDLDQVRADFREEIRKERGDAKPSSEEVVSFTPTPRKYQDWSPKALAIFRELSMAIVAGTHIVEEKDTNPSLAKIDCPSDEKGDVDLGAAKNGSLTCALTGTNLDKVSQLKLRNAQNSTDTVTAEGNVSTSGDSTSATVSFPYDKLCALPASGYKAFTVSNGTESKDSQPMNFDVTMPSLSAGPDPAEVDLSKVKDQTTAQEVNLKGCHLDKVTSVNLVADNGEKIAPTFDGKATSTAVTVTIGPGEVKPVAGKDYSTNKLKLAVQLQSGSSATPIKTAYQLLATGNLSTPAPAPKSKLVKKTPSPKSGAGNSNP